MKKMAGCLLAGLFVALVLGIVVLVWITVGDGGSGKADFDDSDLIAERPVVSAEDNAFTHFERVFAGYQKPVTPPPPELPSPPPDVFAFAPSGFTPSEVGPSGDCLEDFLDGKTYDGQALADFFARNEPVFAEMRKGVGKEFFLEPEITSYDDLLPYLNKWRLAAGGLAARSRLAAQEGRYAEAVEDCRIVMGFGGKILSKPESLISCLVGIAITRIGLNEADTLVRNPDLSLEDLRTLFDELGRLGPYTEGLKRGFRKEYQMSSKVVDDIASGNMSGAEAIGMNLSMVPRVYVFQPLETKKQMAEYFREIVKQVGKCQADFKTPPLVEELDRQADNMIAFFVRPNVVGRMLLGMLLPALDRAHSRLCQLETAQAGIRLMAAVLLYERETGSLPSSLEELVPGMIPEVPRDPFDGRPFRYMPEKRILYSVGDDLTDDGGNANPKGYRAPSSMEPLERDQMMDAVFDF